MFGIGIWEILIILVLALIFIGPKKLPDLARTLGRGLREFRNATNEIRIDFQRMDETEEDRKKASATLPAKTDAPETTKDKPDGDSSAVVESEKEKSPDEKEGGHA